MMSNNGNVTQQLKEEDSLPAKRPKLTFRQRFEKECQLRKLFDTDSAKEEGGEEHVQKVKTLVLDSLSPTDRVIVVGDVHACLNELQHLLESVKFVEGEDTLVLLGDLVGKGPDSIGVLEFARNCKKCYCLLGNHDWTLLRWYEAQRKNGKSEVSFSVKEGNPYVKMSMEITEAQYQFIKSWPMRIDIPRDNIVCVHAGVNPLLMLKSETAESSARTDLDATNGYDMMHMRNVVVDPKVLRQALGGAGESEEKSDSTKDYFVSEALMGEPWGSFYKGPQHVLFGHDAVRSLQQHPFATGLDTGCAYGGKLTAMVLPEKKIASVQSEYNCLK